MRLMTVSRNGPQASLQTHHVASVRTVALLFTNNSAVCTLYAFCEDFNLDITRVSFQSNFKHA